MKGAGVNLRGPLSIRAAAVAENEAMTMDELVDYVLRRFVDDYEFDDDDEEDSETESDDDQDEDLPAEED